MLPSQLQPLPLRRMPAPFSNPDWLFEVKWDGFRALAYIDRGQCRLVSRNGNQFKSFPLLTKLLPSELRAGSAVLDGEIACLDEHGKPQFKDLLFRRADPVFISFDLLWCSGADLRYLPLVDRKRRLRAILPKAGTALLYCDHVDGDGVGLFRLACESDLEGIVAKRKGDPYLLEHADWLKIRNVGYSQWRNREQLFDRERQVEPTFHHWDGCALACNTLDDAS